LTGLKKIETNLENSSIEVDNETELKLDDLYKQATKRVHSTFKSGRTDSFGRLIRTTRSSSDKLPQQDEQKQYTQTTQQLISSPPPTTTTTVKRTGNVIHN